jgi:hypothetical protein
MICLLLFSAAKVFSMFLGFWPEDFATFFLIQVNLLKTFQNKTVPADHFQR